LIDLVDLNVAPAFATPLAQAEAVFQRLTRIVGEMSEPAAFEYRGPDGDMNSVAMLVAHLAWVDMEYLHLIMGKPIPAELEAEYGPVEDENGRIPVVTGRPAAELLARCRRVVDMMQAYFADKPDAEATRELTIPWWPEPTTVRYVLWHMTAHAIHHHTQMKRLQALYSSK
jgi:uncharacterized damage-inducible protein DinB